MLAEKLVVANNAAMTDSEIIDLLDGTTVVARMLGIKPPSVHKWRTDGIPEGRLRELAAQIEIRSEGRFSRRARWPNNYAFYWPELAPTSPPPSQQPTPQGMQHV
jgi:hypothetical protein